MESITSTESVLEVKPAKNPDRVTLSESEAQKIDSWLKQLSEASRGYLSLSRSDLVRFLIQERRCELSSAEIKRLRVVHYDPVRHINWLMPQLKAALAASDAVRVAELQDELRGIQLTATPVETSAKSETEKLYRTRRKRSKKSDQNEVLDDSKSP